MNILLVNPNTLKSPPVAPLGLEYIAASLERNGYKTKIIDLCFSENIFEDLDDSVKAFYPDLVGITVRNVDSVLYSENEFYLTGIKDIVRHLKSCYRIKVVLGGAGLGTNPQGVLEYLGADYAFVGPAEDGIHGFIKKIQNSPPVERISYGKCKPDFTCSRLSSSINYKKYYQDGGIAGFETHKGCSSSCVYCIEANSKVAFKKTKDIVSEINGFIDAGYNHFHLCDSEFNEDLDFSLDFCNTVMLSGMDFKWAVNMKPTNYNRKLFKLMKATGVYLITLTVDSFKKCSLYWSDVEKIIFNAKSNSIFLAVDFLTGFPYEDKDVLIECLDLFRRVQPDRVNINVFIRLYQRLQITKIIMKDRTLHPYLHGSSDDSSLMSPVFYNHVNTEMLKELIQGDALFKIAGIDREVNYRIFQKKLFKKP